MDEEREGGARPKTIHPSSHAETLSLFKLSAEKQLLHITILISTIEHV